MLNLSAQDKSTLQFDVLEKPEKLSFRPVLFSGSIWTLHCRGYPFECYNNQANDSLPTSPANQGNDCSRSLLCGSMNHSYCYIFKTNTEERINKSTNYREHYNSAQNNHYFFHHYHRFPLYCATDLFHGLLKN